MSRLSERATRLPQPMRFIIAGGLAAAVNWLVRFPLEFAMPFIPAVIAATLVGMVVGFISYRSFVFPGSARPLAGQIRDFVAVNLLGMAVTVMVAALLRHVILNVVDVLPQVNAVAHALGITAGALANFLGHKRVTFRSA